MENYTIATILSRAYGVNVAVLSNPEQTLIQCFLPGYDDDYGLNPDSYEVQFHTDGFCWYITYFKGEYDKKGKLIGVPKLVDAEIYLYLNESVKYWAKKVLAEYVNEFF
jgi:hypothetical protein